jgi:hypothetical protein
MQPRNTSRIPDVPEVPPEKLERLFPGGFTVRDEANALTAYAFRNGPIENLHAGKYSPLIDDPDLCRITNDEMKELMIAASEKLAAILRLRDSDPDRYRRFVQDYAVRYCYQWVR